MGTFQVLKGKPELGLTLLGGAGVMSAEAPGKADPTCLEWTSEDSLPLRPAQKRVAERAGVQAGKVATKRSFF